MSKTIKVTVDGEKFTLDVESAKKSGSLKKVWEYPKPGQRYAYRGTCGDDGEKYILATVDSNKFALISLVDGNRYLNPVTTKSHLYVTEKEFNQICGGNKFELVEK